MYLRKEIYGWMKFPFLNTDKMAGNMEVSERKGWSRMLDGGGALLGCGQLNNSNLLSVTHLLIITSRTNRCVNRHT